MAQIARVEIQEPPFSASATARLAAVLDAALEDLLLLAVLPPLPDLPAEVDVLLDVRFVSAINTPYVVR